MPGRVFGKNKKIPPCCIPDLRNISILGQIVCKSNRFAEIWEIDRSSIQILVFSLKFNRSNNLLINFFLERFGFAYVLYKLRNMWLGKFPPWFLYSFSPGICNYKTLRRGQRASQTSLSLLDRNFWPLTNACLQSSWTPVSSPQGPSWHLEGTNHSASIKP